MPNIVFIHGWASGQYVWLHQVSFFKDKYAVYTPRLEYDGANIRDFIVKNKLDDICLVGWSLGGMISMQLAAQMPDKISRLVLIGAPARFTQKPVMEKIYKKMQMDFQGTLEWFYKFCLSSNERSRNEFSEIMKLLGEFIPPFDPDELLKGLRLLMKLDVQDSLSRIIVPTLIIQGSEDKVCPAEAAEFLAKNIKNAKLTIINNAGHAPFLTQPDKVNKLIEEFISK